MFEMSKLTIEQLDCLARSAGCREQALREAVAYFNFAVRDAAEKNAKAFTPEEWELLAWVELGEDDQENGAGAVRPWGAIIGNNLADQAHDRFLGHLLARAQQGTPMPEESAEECQTVWELAGRVRRLSLIRGYALHSALRWRWSQISAPAGWYKQEIWRGENDGTLMIF